MGCMVEPATLWAFVSYLHLDALTYIIDMRRWGGRVGAEPKIEKRSLNILAKYRVRDGSSDEDPGGQVDEGSALEQR